jgi:type II secretory pathway component HofQ
MDWLKSIVVVLALSAGVWGQEAGKAVSEPNSTPDKAESSQDANPQAPAKPVAPAAGDSQNGTTVAAVLPTPTQHDKAQAKKDFSAGSRLKSGGKFDEALEKFEEASQLDPGNVEYATAREVTRQQLVMKLVERGNKAMLAGKEVEASGEFRRALEVDPSNEFARQRLRDSTWQSNEKVPTRTLQVAQNSIEASVSPSSEHKDFHYRGDSRGLLVQVAHAYGITATIDDSVTRRQVRFDIEDVGFTTAMGAATQITKAFWIALSGSQMYVVADTAENRRNFERMAVRTFYLSDLLSPQEFTDTINALRVLFDIRLVQQDAAEQTITIRAPVSSVEAATQMIESVVGARPQLMLDMQVYQISSSLLRQMGTQWPTNFTVFNLSPALLASLVPGSSNLINQLIASGGINQANSQAIQALLAQLQQSAQNSLLSTPFATFGGGKTLMGVSATPPLTVNLNVNESDVRNLEHVTLRASQNTPAVMKIGERYPIVNATFAPIYNNAAIAQVVGNNSYRAPFPSFSFEDLGLNMKATPIIHSNTDVSLKIELNIRTLGGQTVNGIPIINNRQYTGSITLKNEETGVVAGLLSKADSLSLSGYPFLSRVPAANFVWANQNKNVNNDELLIVMTPYITRTASSEGFVVQLPVGH